MPNPSFTAGSGPNRNATGADPAAASPGSIDVWYHDTHYL